MICGCNLKCTNGANQAARGRTLRGTRCGAMGLDRRRRDEGDALSSPRSGEHRDGPMPPQPEGRMAVAGSMRRRTSSTMKEHRLLSAPRLLPASAVRAPPQSSATGCWTFIHSGHHPIGSGLVRCADRWPRLLGPRSQSGVNADEELRRERVS